LLVVTLKSLKGSIWLISLKCTPSQGSLGTKPDEFLPEHF
jgi:hypothetical protein